LYPCLVKEAGNSYLSPWASAFFRKHCKDTKFLGIYIALSPKKIKKTFHAACETTFWARNGRNISKNLEVKRKMGSESPLIHCTLWLLRRPTIYNNVAAER
jgi:hypothetical protein